MNKILLPFILILNFNICNAQWVNIPDSNFGKWLTTTYPTCMQGDPQVGFQMDTSCGGIVNETSIDCSAQNITTLEGLQYFKSLTSLNCSANKLSILPPLQNTLLILNCGLNKLISLPPIPDSLSELFCRQNNLTTLPALPNSLVNLYCEYNQLANLPTLPSTLITIHCYGNLLTYLPTLPGSLKTLNCTQNQITSIPSLPSSLIDLYCGNNLLTSLPSLPILLKKMNCSQNLLINLPPLPDSLTDFSCIENQISSLPTLPSFLKNFYCGKNQLQNLPFLPSSLSILGCQDNTSLNCIPSKLGNMSGLFIAGTGITCMPNRFNCQNFDINPNTLPLCDPQSGCAFYYNITGNVHQKTTFNCIQDSLTPGAGLSNIKMMLVQNGQPIQQAYAYSLGEYSFDTDSNTNYTLSIDTTSLPLNVACPTSFTRNVVLTNADSIKQNQNFGLECKGVDVGVLSIQGRFRAGSLAIVNLVAGDIIKQYYNTNCANNVTGTVVVSYNGSATYVSPAPGAFAPTTVSGNTLSYTVSDFSTLPSNAFNIVLATDTYAVIGSTICITVNVSTAVDINLANNTLSQCFQVVNSYDPNAKEVYPKYISRNGDWLTYTVHFQNTGNDTAYDVIVRDTLSSFVDANSFQFLASSHEKKIIQIKGNAVAITFPNINLVDSATNPAGSQGWFQFKVKTKSTLPLLTNINNTAFIYFDFNPAIKTNTATTVVEPLGINETENASVLQLYPNPNNGSFTLHTTNQIGQAWQLTDVLGRPMAQGVIEKEYELIQLKGSNAGVYIFTCAGQQIRLIVE